MIDVISPLELRRTMKRMGVGDVRTLQKCLKMQELDYNIASAYRTEASRLNGNFAAIDFETANGRRSSVCSVGVVIVRGGHIVDRFYSLIRPVPNYYTDWTTDVHGLTRRDTDSQRFVSRSVGTGSRQDQRTAARGAQPSVRRELP